MLLTVRKTMPIGIHEIVKQRSTGSIVETETSSLNAERFCWVKGESAKYLIYLEACKKIKQYINSLFSKYSVFKIIKKDCQKISISEKVGGLLFSKIMLYIYDIHFVIAKFPCAHLICYNLYSAALSNLFRDVKLRRKSDLQ